LAESQVFSTEKCFSRTFRHQIEWYHDDALDFHVPYYSDGFFSSDNIFSAEICFDRKILLAENLLAGQIFSFGTIVSAKIKFG
jgi:hypothetical protein